MPIDKEQALEDLIEIRELSKKGDIAEDDEIFLTGEKFSEAIIRNDLADEGLRQDIFKEYPHLAPKAEPVEPEHEPGPRGPRADPRTAGFQPKFGKLPGKEDFGDIGKALSKVEKITEIVNFQELAKREVLGPSNLIGAEEAARERFAKEEQAAPDIFNPLSEAELKEAADEQARIAKSVEDAGDGIIDINTLPNTETGADIVKTAISKAAKNLAAEGDDIFPQSELLKSVAEPDKEELERKAAEAIRLELERGTTQGRIDAYAHAFSLATPNNAIDILKWAMFGKILGLSAGALSALGMTALQGSKRFLEKAVKARTFRGQLPHITPKQSVINLNAKALEKELDKTWGFVRESKTISKKQLKKLGKKAEKILTRKRITFGEILGVEDDLARRIEPIAKDIISKKPVPSDLTKVSLAKKLVAEARTKKSKVKFPKEDKVSIFAHNVARAMNPNAPPEVSIAAVAEEIIRLSAGKLTRRASLSGIKTFKPSSMNLRTRKTLERTVKDHFFAQDADALKFADTILNQKGGFVSDKAADSITKNFPGIDVADFVRKFIRLSNLRKHDKVLAVRMASKRLENMRGATLKISKSVAQGMKHPEGFMEYTTKKGRTIRLNIKPSEEILVRGRPDATAAEGAYRDIPDAPLLGKKFNILTLDKNRAIEIAEGPIRPEREFFPGIKATAKEAQRIGAWKLKKRALDNAQLASVREHTITRPIIEERLRFAPVGSSESVALGRFMSGEIPVGQLKTLKKAGGLKAFAEGAKFAREQYITDLIAINKARVAAGRSRIRFRSNPVEHMLDLQLKDKWYGSLDRVPETDLAEIVGSLNSSFYRGQKASGAIGELDATKALLTFNRMANRIKHVDPAAADVLAHSNLIKNAPTFRETMEDMGEAAINPAEGLFAELEEMAGNTALGLFFRKLNRNFVRSVIFGNPSVIANQSFSEAFVVQHAGFTNWTLAFKDLAKADMRAMALQKSTVLKARKLFGSEFVPRGLAGKIDSAIEVANLGLKFVDDHVTLHAFLAGRRKALSLGLKGDAVNVFADNLAEKANLLYLSSALPKILRSRFFRLLQPIQSFTFNNMNNIRFSAPMETAALGAKDRLFGAAKFLGMTMFINMAQAMIGLKAGSDFTDFIPVFGKAARLGGPEGSVGSVRLGVGSESLKAVSNLTNYLITLDRDAFERFVLQASELTGLPFWAVVRRSHNQGFFTPFPQGENDVSNFLTAMTMIPESEMRDDMIAAFSPKVTQAAGKLAGLKPFDLPTALTRGGQKVPEVVDTVERKLLKRKE